MKCGEEHPPDVTELVFLRPDAAASLSEDERKAMVQENADLFIINGKRFFIRAVLPLPVAERVTPYHIGLWVEVNQKDFERVYELWESPLQHLEPPVAATLANDIPLVPTTLGLAADLRLTGSSSRPEVIVQPCTHPLYVEQNDGIDAHRLSDYTRVLQLLSAQPS